MRVNIGVIAVYVPPVAKVRVLTNIVAAAGVDVVPVKFSALNQLLVVMVMIAAPLVIAKFGALVADPLVVPNVNVLVIEASETNPPVEAVSVKFVASAMLSTMVAAVVCDKMILLDPNEIDLVPVPVELKIPVVKLLPLRARAPAVSVVVAVAISD